MKIDPHHHKEKYTEWREEIKGNIPDMSKVNSDLILQYLDDMEKRLNTKHNNGRKQLSKHRTANYYPTSADDNRVK